MRIYITNQMWKPDLYNLLNETDCLAAHRGKCYYQPFIIRKENIIKNHSEYHFEILRFVSMETIWFINVTHFTPSCPRSLTNFTRWQYTQHGTLRKARNKQIKTDERPLCIYRKQLSPWILIDARLVQPLYYKLFFCNITKISPIQLIYVNSLAEAEYYLWKEWWDGG